MRKLKGLSKRNSLAPDVQPVPIPVPTGGWDASSPLAAMDAKYAVVLDNWVPRPGWIELRPGYVPYAPITSSPVESLMCYRSPTAQKLFAASGGSIYDVSVAGSSTVVQSGKSNARWQYVNFSPQGSSTYYLWACNGVDTPIMYDGTSWSNPTITGITPTQIINVQIYNRRLWFTLSGKTQFAYLPTDAIQGAAVAFDIGALWDQGGKAVAMGTWTVDGGTGPNNYAAFISSRGQVTLYLGIDPANANTWNLVGTFNLPPPLGTRCMTRIGSDIGLITLQGVIPLSQALPFDPSAVRSVALTSQIQNAMAQAAQYGQFFFGWQLITYPAQTLAFLNVPTAENSSQMQFVMNALTGAWCRFTGWNANCFELYNDLLYFGDNDGTVNLAYSGSADGQSAITADVKCAFNYMGAPGRTKRITMVQPMMVADGDITPTISVDVDFSDTSPSSPVQSFSTIGAAWDSAQWDAAQWATGIATVTSWLAAEGIGNALALRMKVNFLPTGVGGFDNGVFDSIVFDAATDSPTLQVNHFNVLVEMGSLL